MRQRRRLKAIQVSRSDWPDVKALFYEETNTNFQLSLVLEARSDSAYETDRIPVWATPFLRVVSGEVESALNVVRSSDPKENTEEDGTQDPTKNGPSHARYNF